jgi:hypothetical protein
MYVGQCRAMLTCDVGGALLPFSTPWFACHPGVLCHPIACDGGRAGWWRGIPVQTHLPAHKRRGACHATAYVPAPILVAPPAPVHMPLLVHAQMGAPPLCTTYAQAGGRRGGVGGYATCQCFCALLRHMQAPIMHNGGGIEGEQWGVLCLLSVQLSVGEG